MLNEEKPFYIKLSHGLTILVLLLLILYVAQHILMPLAFAGLFAILLIAPCKYLEKHGLSRGISAMLSLLGALILFTVISYFISSQLLNFKKDIPSVIAQLTIALQNLENAVKQRFSISSNSMDEFIHSVTSQTLSFSLFSTTFSTLSGTVVYFLIIILYVFLLLLYRGLMVKFLLKSFADSTSKVLGILTDVRYVIKSYLLGLITEMVIVAFLNCLGFFILGVKYFLLLGVIAALLNLVPYLGIFIACILSMLVTFTTNTPGTVAGVGIVLLIVHLIDGNILFPRIVGSKVKMNALATIFGVLVGGALWGIPGMFLAIPLIAILKVVLEEVEGMQSWCILLGDDIKAKEVRLQSDKLRSALSWKKGRIMSNKNE